MATSVFSGADDEFPLWAIILQDICSKLRHNGTRTRVFFSTIQAFVNHSLFSKHIQFKHKVVRDLAWAIGSPGLLSASDWVSDAEIDRLWDTTLPWLSALDHNPHALTTWIANRGSFRLGRYFEDLLSFWLHETDTVELLAANQQIVAKGKSLGEFDFVFVEATTRACVHWEVAVKFYLGSSASGAWNTWIGPGAKDRLAFKLKKVLDHQLRLPQTAEGKSAIQALGVHALKSQCFLKGYFFMHSATKPEAAVFPNSAGGNHERGYWCRKSELPNWVAGDAAIKMLKKKEWLGAQVCFETELNSMDELQPQILHSINENGSICLGIFEQRDKLWVEQERWMVVPDNWPYATA